MFVAMRVVSNFLGPKSRWEAHCERIIFDWVEEGDDLIQVHIPILFYNLLFTWIYIIHNLIILCKMKALAMVAPNRICKSGIQFKKNNMFPMFIYKQNNKEISEGYQRRN